MLVGYISPSTASRLPRGTFATYAIAATVIILSGLWRMIVTEPQFKSSHGLNLKTILKLLRLTSWLEHISYARFIVPLCTSRLGWFSVKPNPIETVLWFGILSFSTVASRVLPMLSGRLVEGAEEVLARDPRKPVLYFRSFEKEAEKAVAMSNTLFVRNLGRSPGGIYIASRRHGDTLFGKSGLIRGALNSKRTPFDEQMVFADAFNQLGPYIALGRPNESFRDMDLGAAKKYVSNDEWEGVVRKWLWGCGAVVLEAADSASLGWEIGKVIELVPPTRIVIICPYTDGEYENFTRIHRYKFPVELPDERPDSRLLIFDKLWRPIELENVDMCASETLEPFFTQARS